MSNQDKVYFDQLLDDIKIVSKAIKIAKDEHNPFNRVYACNLVNDLYTTTLMFSSGLCSCLCLIILILV
jgi:hypothetical protein